MTPAAPGQTAESGAQHTLTLAGSRPATLGNGRLICLDGPAGSGKTTMSADLAAAATPIPLLRQPTVVHLDDLYAGWDGLAHLSEQLDPLLLPLAEGRPGHYRRYDWRAGAFREAVTVPPAPLLILEGVGSGAAAYDSLRTVLVWVDAPADIRKTRSLERDGAAFAPHWDAWARDERALFGRERTRERADLVISTG